MTQKTWQMGTFLLTVIVLFFIPFFWLKSGLVNLGADGGRFYFLDPGFIATHIHAYFVSNLDIGYISNSFAYLPFDAIHYLFLAILKDPTTLINASHGGTLVFSFLSVFLFTRALLDAGERNAKPAINVAAYLAAIVYVSMVTVYGWDRAIPALQTVYVYPLCAYLLLKALLTNKRLYLYSIALISLVSSINFGFTNAPQFFAFVPLVAVFIALYVRFVRNEKIIWKDFFIFGILFIGIQSFHILPTFISLFARSGNPASDVFSASYIQSGGVKYFDFNRYEFGKISTSMFQPAQFFHSGMYIFIVPILLVLGFIRKPSRLLALSGVFFVATLFLVSANITHALGSLYRLLFFLPGFVMFRSFWEKWYWVYAFFYALTFGLSFYSLVRGGKRWITLLAALVVIGTTIFRISPFLQGSAVQVASFQNNGVSPVFEIDPDTLAAVEYIKGLPQDGRVLTLPLTFPNYQIFFGRRGGAYWGISAISGLGGRQDFSGFWSFGPYENPMFRAIESNDHHTFLQLLSLLNIRYIFRDSDPRVTDSFSGFPLVFPGMTYSSKDKLPVIRDQKAYDSFLAKLPMKKIYEQGFYSVYEISDSSVRPFVYIPDEVVTSQDKAVSRSFRSAYVDTPLCTHVRCDEVEEAPEVSYIKKSPVSYEVTIRVNGRKTPFILILSNAYHTNWDLSFDQSGKTPTVNHVPVNGYANGWVIDPSNMREADVINGSIYLTSQHYFYAGAIISGITLMTVLFLTITEITRRKHA